MSGLKGIAPVPTSDAFLDVVLSKTQRKTPTVIHNGFKISRIRKFYMRKVKFAHDTFREKIDSILAEFPILDNLHPFLSALLNVLYDKNHYKLALGHLATARHLIDGVGKDYVRLLKFGDSLYRCKQLKKAALGRMATIIKRQKDSLAYLEHVRQHMSRLPGIDPTTRTLLVCGYPNVGKSSFLNSVTRADVDVQPYAFTTKSLFVGHMDYKYLRWQVVDTPGVLDHPLEEMNTIEMQSVTALAHLRAAILYFVDLSEQCGYTLEAQCKLFESISPLFANKPVFVVVNKIDVVRLEDLSAEKRAVLDAIVKPDEQGTQKATLLQLSCHSQENVSAVRNAACDALLAMRVEQKEKSKRAENVAGRLRIAVPVPRDGVARTPFIPPGALEKRAKAAKESGEDDLDVDVDAVVRTEKELEEEAGGAGAHVVDLKRRYLLKDPSWNHDAVPEIVDGKNVADFIDPDILARLDALEAEETRLEAEGFYESDSVPSSDDEVLTSVAESIRTRKTEIRMDSTARNKRQNKPVVPRTVQRRTLDDMTKDLKRSGIDTTSVEERAKLLLQAREVARAGEKRKRRTGDGDGDEDGMDEDGEDVWESAEEEMDVDEPEGSAKKRRKSEDGKVVAAKRKPVKDRTLVGLRDEAQAEEARKQHHIGQRERNRLAKAGDADRAIRVKMPKHLYSGKRKGGKTNRR